MGLGDLVLETLKKVVDYIIELADDFADVLKRGLRMFLSSILADDLEIVEKFIDAVTEATPELKEMWSQEKEKIRKGETGAIGLLGIFLGSMVGTGVGMGLGGFGRDIQNFFNKLRPVNPLTPDLASYGKHTGKITEEDFKEHLLAQGYNEKWHSVMFDYYKPKLSVSDLLEAEKRIEELDIDVTEALKAHGYNDKEIKILRQLSWAYPSPSDFIRFSVREVFTTDRETKEALQAEFPEDIIPYAKKAGMSEDVLMWYWMAHWELPSPTQVYEMLHRLNPKVLEVRGEAYKQMGINVENIKTTIDTVKTFLKQADYDIRWRDRLLAISYSPLTRVDLRRIYALGLIDDKELKARLMEIGYTEKDAELLMEFYHNLRVEEAREWTKSEIKNLLYYGLINDTEAKIMLERLGYKEEDAKLLIDLWKAKITEKDMRETQRYIRDAYALGQITRAEAEAQLKACGLSEEVIKVVLDKEEKRRMSSQRLPSASTIVKWLKMGIITKDVAYRLLKRINVADDVIDYYIKEAEVS